MLRTVLVDRDGEEAATYGSGFLPRSSADLLLCALLGHRSAFKSGFMLVGGRWVKTPRLVAEFGDGIHLFPDTGPNLAWTAELRELRDRTASVLGQPFNYAIVNWYRDGRDLTGWHTDKMDLHAPGSAIAMVSIGSMRRFAFRDSDTGRVVSTVDPSHGSLLVMYPPSQRGYEHSLRPDRSVHDVRISVTFRQVLPSGPPVCPVGAIRHDALQRRRTSEGTPP